MSQKECAGTDASQHSRSACPRDLDSSRFCGDGPCEWPQLLAADVDGTILEKFTNISEKTRSVLEQCHEAGISFAVASGRPVDEVQEAVRNFDLNFVPDYVIGMNGGEIYCEKDGTLIRQYPLTADQLKTLVEAFQDDNCNIMLYKNGMLYCKKRDQLMELSVKRSHKPEYVVRQLCELYDADNPKVMFRTDTAQEADQILEKGRALNLEGISFFKTQPNLVEACDSRVNKGQAIAFLADKYGYDMERILAFGDASNDNEMLSMAGLSVCLLDGLPDTKACARWITEYPCREDGMARWIEKYILDKSAALPEESAEK